MLISEAARGEGGRLFYKKDDGSNCYFMEDKYPQLGNLEGARFTFDIFMLLRPDKNAFANEGFELRFPLQGWFNTLSQLIKELNTMHKVGELLKL